MTTVRVDLSRSTEDGIQPTRGVLSFAPYVRRTEETDDGTTAVTVEASNGRCAT